MAKLDLEWLKVFVEVFRAQSVTDAARQLGIGQANASIALNKLRRHFDDRLFVRTSRGMAPTPFAQRIHPEIASMVQRLAEISGTRPVFDPRTANRQFRIGMTDISEINILPDLVNHLARVAPGVQIESVRITSDSARQLESGEIDLAVGFMPHLEAGFYQQTLFMQTFVVLASGRHPRIRRRPTRAAFLAEGHISVTTSGTGHAIVDKVLSEKGCRRRIVLRVPSFLAVARLVARTELLVVVPRRLGEAMAGEEPIQIFEPPVPLPPFGVKQHWHQRFHEDAANAWLRRELAALFGPSGRNGGAEQRRR